jgi:hypothetical protein
MDQATVEKQIEVFVVDRYQGQRVNRLIEVGEQTAGQCERIILESAGAAVMDDEVHVRS